MIELNKIYQESNLETMKRMEDRSIDYVLTSPPYNIGSNKYEEFKDNYSKDQYFEQQRDLINFVDITTNQINA